MLFLTSELAKKAEITILPVRDTTRPGFQEGASWVERKGHIRGSEARDNHLGGLIFSFFFQVLLLHYRQSYLCKASVEKASHRRSISHRSYPDFLPFFQGFFCGRFFLASTVIALLLLAVAQLRYYYLLFCQHFCSQFF